MANKFRNELEIKVGDVNILLRPTFENCANLEAGLGYGLPMLAWRLSKQQMPSMTDVAKVIYFCQAEKKLTLEQVWDLVMSEGVSITTDILRFTAQITAGDKTASTSVPEAVKKN